MSDRYPGALLVSLTLHGAVVGLMLLFAYAANQSRPETTQVFELVAGPGDNYPATEAPALGEPGALKLDLPKPAPEQPKPQEAPKPEPVAAAPIPPPVADKPVPKAPEEKPMPKLPDAKSLEKRIAKAETKTKAKLEKEHEADAKKAAKITKEQFDKENTKKVASARPSTSTPPKVAQIDAQGIRKGVEGGSPNNKTGGANGKALVRPDGPVMDAYWALLKDRLLKALDKPPGLADSLVTEIQVRINPNGSLTGAKITKSSGSAEFDAAAMAAVSSVSATGLPPHPEKKSELLTLPFRMKEIE
jgi:colicin import membrane protein